MFKHSIASMIVLLVILSGCDHKQPEDQLIGTWEASGFIPPHEAARLSGESMPDGATLEVTYSGVQSYHLGNKYDGEGTMTLRVRDNGREIALRLYVKDAGSWQLHGNTLVETSKDSVIAPLDDLTKTLISEMPELKAGFMPVQGMSSSSEIKHMSASTVELELQNPKGLRVTLRKS